MNIALIGSMGSGKTTICRLLSRSLGKKAVSIDEEFMKIAGMNPEKFVKKHGVERFLEMESEIIERLSNLDECVFDTHHSIIARNENITSLKKSSLVVFLAADQKTLSSRLKGKSPLENLQNYEQRFASAADYTIDTSRLSPEDTCNLISHFIQMELH